VEAQNLNLELIRRPLLARPAVEAHLVVLQQHRQVLSQNMPNVVFQGRGPTIVVGEDETILGDPGDYLVLVEVSGQVDGTDSDPTLLHRPWRPRARRLLSFRFRKRGKAEEPQR